jgi:fibronectin type 3 domain-containing protein
MPSCFPLGSFIFTLLLSNPPPLTSTWIPFYQLHYHDAYLFALDDQEYKLAIIQVDHIIRLHNPRQLFASALNPSVSALEEHVVCSYE